MPHPRWYYLSEIAASSQHGGGLTLQRVLGPDLQRFERFFHVAEFASSRAILPELAPRQVNLHEQYPLTPQGSPRYYVQRFKERLGLEPHIDGLVGHRVQRSVRHILQNVPLDDSSWLVVPQGGAIAVRVMNRVFAHHPVDYIAWMMDDHAIRWDDGWRYPAGLEDEMRELLSNARKVFVISPAMGRLYQDRFGVPSDVLFGPADPVDEPVFDSPTGDGPVRLCYFGSVFSWQLDALAKTIAALPAANAVLDLYAMGDTSAIPRSDRVSFQPPVRADEVMRKMRDYDGVLIPVGFGAHVRGLSELNIATKMSECLASGTAVVVVGPAYAAMVDFVSSHGAGIVVVSPDEPSQWLPVARLKERSLRERVLAGARRTVETVCSVAAMQETWHRAWHDPHVVRAHVQHATT